MCAEQGISQGQLRAVILRFVELYISNKQAGKKERQQWTSGTEFASRLLANNRELFEELAKHCVAMMKSKPTRLPSLWFKFMQFTK